MLVGPSLEGEDEPWYFSLNNRRLWVLKQLREDKAAVTEKILSYMKDINVDSCRLPSGGRVAVKVTHKKPKLTGKELMELIGTHSPTLCAIIDREEGNKEEQVKTTLVHKS